MNGPSFDAKFWGGSGGSLRYDLGTVVTVKIRGGGQPPADWSRKSKLQEAFGDFGHILRIEAPQRQAVAYVEYDDKRDAEDAVREMHGKKVCGCVVDCEVAGSASKGSAGQGSVQDRVFSLANKYDLDGSAAGHLARVFTERSRLATCCIDDDLAAIEEHLAASNKPSALVCKMLNDIRSGRPIEPCQYSARRAAPPGGSRDHEHSRRRSRSRGRRY
eukprot:TRINITY_DN41292_c0_g1_i1.p1 TRINITY_DN41292_c0_g1~~TRINITY_DN41292_c0_g1_i1.p1  ORF type:complete len:217 (-),score=30.79 TRINITY_DN41292_c0_g1_i1:6-656(-)